MTVSVLPRSPYHPDALILVDHLWQDLDGRYGPNPRSRFTPEQLDLPDSLFVVAYREGRAAGCGALLALEPGVGEIKRMWTEAWARRQGIAARVLAHLESAARHKGWHGVRLETGIRQPEAIAFYRRQGYDACDCWGVYRGDPISRCFQKELAAPGPGPGPALSA